MIQIYDNTIVYIACPASFQTGGTEALHVLAYEMRKLNVNAVMYYTDVKNQKDVVGERFKIFNVPYVFDIQDAPHNVVIVPELFANILNSVKFAQRVFWWLSVDNYFEHLPKINLKKRIWAFITHKKNPHIISLSDQNILHLAQSEYAMDFLARKHVRNKAFLADYLRDDFFATKAYLKSNKRKDIVIYNPKKGFDFTKKLIESAPDLTFRPLENMTPEQVRELCAESKVYIDFGNHPGKDRFPREAAIQGNIIIVGNRGSAVFYGDVPIKPEYKFDVTENNIHAIINQIRDCMKNYDTKIDDFAYYRSVIENDHDKFVSDLKNILQFM